MTSKIITICGSMRFYDKMLEVAGTETANGNIVLMPFVTVEESRDTAKLKAMLDGLHLEKIAMSQSVVLVAIDGYVGESTRKEISFAASRGVPITWRVER